MAFGDRRTPLKRGRSQLKRSRLNQRSAKTKARHAPGSEYNQAKADVRVRSGGRCEIVAGTFCTGVAHDPHHRFPHGSDTAVNLLDTCRPCHDWVHAHPAVSYDNGWLLHTEPSTATGDPL